MSRKHLVICIVLSLVSHEMAFDSARRGETPRNEKYFWFRGGTTKKVLEIGVGLTVLLFWIPFKVVYPCV